MFYKQLEYKELIEQKLQDNFNNCGGVKGLNISIKDFTNLRKILYGLQEKKRNTYVLHPKYGNLTIPLPLSARQNEQILKNNIINIYNSDLNDDIYLNSLLKNNLGNLIKFPIYIDIEEEDNNNNNNTQDINEYLSLLQLNKEELYKIFNENSKYWTIKKLKHLLKTFKLKTSAPKKIDLIERIVRNLPLMNKCTIIEHDKAKISWKKVKTHVGNV